MIAVNLVGPSLNSAQSDDIRVALKPSAPGDPVYTESTQTTMQLTWTSPEDAGRSNGGTDLLGYIIQWDDGDSAATQLQQLVQIDDASTVTFTIDNSEYAITIGLVYRVRVLAFNIIGTGSPSAILEIMPASLPSAPN